MVLPVSVSGWFFGTKNPPWLVERSCSWSPGDTLNPGRVIRLPSTFSGGVCIRSSCVHLGLLASPQPNQVLRGRMPEVWRHGLI